MEWIEQLKESTQIKKTKMSNTVLNVSMSNKIFRKAANYLYKKGCYVCVIPKCDRKVFCFMLEKTFKQGGFDEALDYYYFSDFVVNQYTGQIVKNRFNEADEDKNILEM